MQINILNAIEKERTYQKEKWGTDKEQSLPGFLVVMRHELDEAERAWNKNVEGNRQTPLEEIVQVVATGIACLETYGTEGSAKATNDVSTVHDNGFIVEKL